MNSQIKNMDAVELSEQELDTVAGGLAVTLGDVKGYASDAANDFFQKNLTVVQQTSAGPQGSYTGSVTKLEEISSSAGQAITIG